MKKTTTSKEPMKGVKRSLAMGLSPKVKAPEAKRDGPKKGK